MKRTIIATTALIALTFAASFFVERTPAQGVLKPVNQWGAVGGYYIERFEAGETCVVIVSRGDQFSAVPCR